MKEHIIKLKELRACPEAIEWAKQFNSIQEAWDNCERGDWMLWLLGKQVGSPRSKSRKELVLIACKCARLSLKYVPKSEKRPLKAIQTAEKWVRGEATLRQVRYAAYAARAAYAAYAADAAVAAYAADAAYAAYAADAILLKCATIVRKYHPKIKLTTKP